MERPKEKLVVVRSGPGGAAVGLSTAAEMARQGERVTLCLIQDGVLCALKGNQTAAAILLAEAVEAGVGLRYLGDDLAARGFAADDLLVGASPLGYGELAELMLAGDRHVLGAF
ncbi:MAG: DsrE family protein [Actinobacteria bacterium]|nr:DsrE family protein [Actinomycetota bacterium]